MKSKRTCASTLTFEALARQNRGSIALLTSSVVSCTSQRVIGTRNNVRVLNNNYCTSKGNESTQLRPSSLSIGCIAIG